MSDDEKRLEVVRASEPWTSLLLEDGSELRFRLPVAKVYRMVGKFDPAGEPSYRVEFGPVTLAVIGADHLRRPSLRELGATHVSGAGVERRDGNQPAGSAESRTDLD